ncbi:MAG: methyltransferase domain-containing protein, partial [Planctomycetes bacterium]|nr:methyltransferase domain-containing protein [Planctomycetota bacterium]
MSKGDTSLPFDQYQRYRLVADLIDRARGSRGPLRILDVGGRTGLLAKFLPKDRVDLVDLESSEIRGLVLGDGSRLPFAPESFDVVVSFDTLEHVPTRRRAAFIEESWRVAKSWVIHAGPYQTKRVEDAEARLRAFLSEKLQQEHRYLEEHHSHGLPKRGDVEGRLKELGGEVLSVGHANIERWLGLMCLAMYMDRDEPLRGLASEFHRFYNEALYAHDHEGEVYRHAVVAAFNGAPLPDTEGLFSAQAAPLGSTKPINALVKELMRFDVQRDAIVPEWERLHEVNAALADDIGQHARALSEAREEIKRRKEMTKQLRLDARDLRVELKVISREAREERKASAAALKALEQDLGGNVRAREALEGVVAEREAEMELVQEELDRERKESSQSIAALEADLASHHEVRAELEELLKVRDAAGEELARTLEEQSQETEEVVRQLTAELEAHQEATSTLEAELEALGGHVGGLEEELEKQRAAASKVIEALETDLAGHKESHAEMSATYAGQLEAVETL